MLKHRAHHVRHTQLPLNREEEESRVINCETTFRNRFEDLRRCFDLVRFALNKGPEHKVPRRGNKSLPGQGAPCK